MERYHHGCRLTREPRGYRVIHRGGVAYLYRDSGLGLSYVQQPYRGERVSPRRWSWRCVSWAVIVECAVYAATAAFFTWMFVCGT